MNKKERFKGEYPRITKKYKKNSLQNEINELEKKKPMNIEDISQNLTKKIKDITEKEVVIQTKDI